MYPLLNNNIMLLKQYEHSILYPLLKDNQGIEVTNGYTYEKINQTAAEILELCNGNNSIQEIVKIVASRYSENLSRATELVNRFINEAINKSVVFPLDYQRRFSINVSGNYSTIFPFYAQIELTKYCPLRCLHCFNSSGIQRPDEMNTSDAMMVIDKLADMGVRKVMLTGGEPTSRQDFIAILESAYSRFIGISIASNGYLVTEELAKSLIRFQDKIVVQISLDGSEKNHNRIRGKKDSHAKAISAIKTLAQYGLKVTVATTFNSFNICDINDVTLTAKQLGAKQISYGATFDVGRAKKNMLAKDLDLELLLKKALNAKQQFSDSSFYVHANDIVDEGLKQKAHTCGRGTTQVCVRENGDVSPCLQFNFVYGNLVKQEIDEIFDYQRIKVFNSIVEPNLDTCADCPTLNSCRGCLANAYNFDSSTCKWQQVYPEELKKLERISII